METGDRRIFPKPIQYNSQAHEALNPWNMAHRVDVREFFKTSLIEKAGKVGIAKTKKNRIEALFEFAIDLGDYSRFHKIDSAQVKDSRRKKDGMSGLFDQGFILIAEDGEHLVRDKVPQLFKEGKYRKVSGKKELLDLLGKKLVEKSSKLMYSSANKRVEEMADVLEVIYSFMGLSNIDPDEVFLKVQAKDSPRYYKERAQERWLAETGQSSGKPTV